jgi:hypothetical protein
LGFLDEQCIRRASRCKPQGLGLAWTLVALLIGVDMEPLTLIISL